MRFLTKRYIGGRYGWLNALASKYIQAFIVYEKAANHRPRNCSHLISEYDHQSETRYKNEVLVDGDPVLFEICDLCPRHNDDLPSMETLTWADGVVLVYSITERNSFNFIKQVWNIFQVNCLLNSLGIEKPKRVKV